MVSEAVSAPVSTDEAEVKDEDEEPTTHELLTLRRVPGTLPWTAHTIAFVEMCERLSFCGTVAVFVNFIQQPLPKGSVTGAGFEGQSGALGLGQRAATAITTFDALWVYLMPLLGGYMADAHWGRYKTIMIACAAAVVGHALLIVSSIPPVIVSVKASMSALILGIIIMGLGTGGFKASVGIMMAEQTTNTNPRIKVLKCGERVIIDNDLTVSRAYMYFYLMLNVGAIIGETGMVYAEKYIGFWLAYTIPLLMFFICPLVMLLSRKHYVRSPPSGSVLSQAFKLWRLATMGQWSFNPVRTYKNLSNPELWERVKPSTFPADLKPEWMTFPDSWVDEVHRALKACKVLCWYPILWLGYNQMLHNLTSQAATMHTHGLPNDFFSNVNPFTLIVAIPIFDQFLYPALRRANFNPTPLRKITVGFVMAFVALVWAATLQLYIYRLSPCGIAANKCSEPAPISAWLQAGPFGLFAISEMLAVTTGMEYCFSKAPTNMRSLVYAIYLFMTAVASAIGQAFVTLSDDPFLVWNYATIAFLMFFGTCGFWLTCRGLDKEEGQLQVTVAPAETSFKTGEGDLEK